MTAELVAAVGSDVVISEPVPGLAAENSTK